MHSENPVRHIFKARHVKVGSSFASTTMTEDTPAVTSIVQGSKDFSEIFGRTRSMSSLFTKSID
jgi:hypothetical protein